MSDARPYAVWSRSRAYSRIKDRKSPIKGSRPSVPHGTNFLCFISVLWHCWLDCPANSWVLVCWWWQIDWMFADIIAPVVTAVSIILSCSKIQNGDIPVSASLGCVQMAVKWVSGHHYRACIICVPLHVVLLLTWYSVDDRTAYCRASVDGCVRACYCSGSTREQPSRRRLRSVVRCHITCTSTLSCLSVSTSCQPCCLRFLIWLVSSLAVLSSPNRHIMESSKPVSF